MQTASLDRSLLEDIEAYAVAIARHAGQIVLDQFRGPLDVRFKSKNNRDPVTVADRLSDEYLKGAIKEKYPAHGILSEEGEMPGGSESPFAWVLDPLDGTCNFMNGMPLFAVSVGVMWNRRPVAGSIYVPVSHRATAGVYHARLDNGAFLDGEKIAVCTKPSARPLSQMPTYSGSRYRLSGPSRKQPHETRNLGSMALELAFVAAGVLEYGIFGRPRLWDIAAGVVLVKEAGGVCLVKMQRVRKWSVLDQFGLEKGGKDTDKLEGLRDWTLPIFVAAPETAKRVTEDIRIRRRVLDSLKAWFTGRRR